MSLNKPIWKLRDKIDKNQLKWGLISYNNWKYLTYNKIRIETIEWFKMSDDTTIFELDYESMRENNREMYEDLIKEVMKPSRVFKDPEYDYIEELFGD